jgi:hypothetical protein
MIIKNLPLLVLGFIFFKINGFDINVSDNFSKKSKMSGTFCCKTNQLDYKLFEKQK